MPKQRARSRDTGRDETPDAFGAGTVAAASAPRREAVQEADTRPVGTGTADPSDRRLRARPVIESLCPEVDGGRFPSKAVVGGPVAVEADVFVDGHDLVDCDLEVRWPGASGWVGFPMAPLGNDRWRAVFTPTVPGRADYVVRAWVDTFGTWQRDLRLRADGGRDIRADLEEGEALVRRAVLTGAVDSDVDYLSEVADALHAVTSGQGPCDLFGPVRPAGESVALADVVLSPDLHRIVRRCRAGADVTSDERTVLVEDPIAGCGAWYELFPRSASPDPGRPGTLADVVGRLPYVAAMGFDVLYLPPIHPIGTTARKGRDGATSATAGEPGSPWAIGGPAGGHTAVDPSLGTLDDLDALVAAAAGAGLRVALDLAFQCSPDHPWVVEHPSWFRHLPDGSIRPAENPPKRYEDIYPLDFDTSDWHGLWLALRDVVLFWIGHGVSVFRCDNPHTKPFGFWEWLLESVRAEHPGTVFLSEAFTRPAVMKRLAKVGFSQSYTYFTWRHTKWELETYLTELTTSPVADYLRPNLWPNTPDILAEDLQGGTTAAFCARLVLAATLAANYGIYGPAFELQEHVPRAPGSEEYADSEKYAVRHWDLGRADTLAGFVGRVNRVRRDHPALRRDDTLAFLPVDNDHLIAYAKTAPPSSDGDPPDVVVVVVNLDPVYTQSGWLHLDPVALGLPADTVLTAHDLLTDARFPWEAGGNFVRLDPAAVPAHLLHLTALGVEPATTVPETAPARHAGRVAS